MCEPELLIRFIGYCILQAVMTIGQGGKSLHYSNSHMKIFPPVVDAEGIYSSKSQEPWIIRFAFKRFSADVAKWVAECHICNRKLEEKLQNSDLLTQTWALGLGVKV